MKVEKAAGMGGAAAEFLTNGWQAMGEWLKIVFNVCMNVARALED